MRRHGTVKRICALIIVCSMMVGLLSMQAAAKPGDEKYQQMAEAIAKANGTQVVKTIWWKAKTTARIKTTTTETGAEVKLEKGEVVTIVQRDYHEKNGISQCMLSDETHCYIANKYLKITDPITTGAQGDYDVPTKEAYVNGHSIPSNTNMLIWISLDKQRVNIFTGSNHHWQLMKVFKTSTGKADAPTLDETFLRKYYVQKKKRVVDSLQFYTFFYGSGIHKWPGGGMSKNIGKTPVSHSCVRLNGTNAKWVFDNNNIPLKTRVWIW